jgi:hypothetical protein
MFRIGKIVTFEKKIPKPSISKETGGSAPAGAAGMMID